MVHNHQIDITVNNQSIELFDAEKLNLRLNNVLFVPEEMTAKTGEYSFSFEIPATPRNNLIFNFANNMSKLNKFNTLYDCQLNVDGLEIFNGTLRLSDTKQDRYTCNLISIKVNKVEEIFKDTKMNELDWKVPFAGTSTINSVNAQGLGYYFPLVCYGAFQKKPYANYGGDVNVYTDITQIDAYNRWYWESFHPSFNLIELVKRCFAHKGYNVSGDILNDKVMNNIYLSECIDSSQDPTLNLNSSAIGDLFIKGTFTPGSATSGRGSSSISQTPTRSSGGVTSTYTQSLPTKLINSLMYPHEPVGVNDEYNFDTVTVWDIFATPASTTDPTATHYFINQPSNKYIYRQASKDSSSGFIQVPADGLYTIELEAGVDITNIWNEFTKVTYKKKVAAGSISNPTVETEEVEFNMQRDRTFDNFPVEIQLVRNTDEPELIYTAEPVITTNPSLTEAKMGKTQYPHEPNSNAYILGAVSSSVRGGRRGVDLGDRYYVDKGTTIAYDPKANEGFICGFTTINRSASVLKNGNSWDVSLGQNNQTHYRQPGYKKCIYGGGLSYTGTELTERNQNTLLCPSSDTWKQTLTTANGKITCVVKLNKNDIVSLKVLTKSFNDITYWKTGRNGRMSGSGAASGTYAPDVTYSLKITPYTDKWEKYKNAQNMNYLADASVKEQGWGTKLNLAGFLNKQEKMSDFISNFLTTFNLSYNQVDRNVFINKTKMDLVTVRNSVDIDDRVNTSEGKASRIDYPGYMQAKWSIDEEEAGAYRSIDTVAHQGASNWKDYIDRGSDKVQMDTTNESKETSVESKFSYTWYQRFKVLEYDTQTGLDTGTSYYLTMPLIAKDEDFIIQNDEAMSKDGLSLKQRMWFRDETMQKTLELWDGSSVNITVPVSEYNGVVMNYRSEQGSLLNRYFNVVPRTDSNYMTIEVYITPFEYIMLKNGAFVKVDDDLYIVSEIQGYDPSGANMTELKLIKKV